MIEEREFRNVVYFDNLYAGIIAPEIKTPRVLIRILNSLKITWPAIKGEVRSCTEFPFVWKHWRDPTSEFVRRVYDQTRFC